MSINMLRMSLAGHGDQASCPFGGVSVRAPSAAQEYGIVYAGLGALFVFGLTVSFQALMSGFAS